jgi:uncharacterized membrane protein YkvA (DUF1232 family)
MRGITFRVILKRIKAIRFMMMDPKVSKWKKLLVVFGIVYVLIPIDIIPIAIFPFGFLDDLVLWIWILFYLRDTLDKYWMGEKEVDLSKKFDGKTVIDDVEYEVEPDNGSSEEK